MEERISYLTLGWFRSVEKEVELLALEIEELPDNFQIELVTQDGINGGTDLVIHARVAGEGRVISWR